MAQELQLRYHEALMTHFSRLGSQSAAMRFAGAALLQVRTNAELYVMA